MTYLVIRHEDGCSPEIVETFNNKDDAEDYIILNSLDGFGNLSADYNCPYLYIEEVEPDLLIPGWHEGPNGFFYGPEDQNPDS
jgi:hypothetical protein